MGYYSDYDDELGTGDELVDYGLDRVRVAYFEAVLIEVVK